MVNLPLAHLQSSQTWCYTVQQFSTTLGQLYNGMIKEAKTHSTSGIPTFIASTNTWAVALSMRSDRVAGNFKPPREEWMNAKTPLMPLLSLALPYRWKTCKWFHCQQSQRISWLRFALRRALQSEFVRERNWDKHHTPRNLLLAMVGTFETQTVTRYDLHGLFSLSTRLGKLENYQRSCKK